MFQIIAIDASEHCPLQPTGCYLRGMQESGRRLARHYIALATRPDRLNSDKLRDSGSATSMCERTSAKKRHKLMRFGRQTTRIARILHTGVCKRMSGGLWVDCWFAVLNLRWRRNCETSWFNIQAALMFDSSIHVSKYSADIMK